MIPRDRTRLPRRRLLAAPALLLAPAAAAHPPGPGFAFRVLRRGEPIGTHSVHFTHEAHRCLARSELRIAARAFGIVVYRYEHLYEEETVAGRFRRVTSRLDRNGRRFEVEAERGPDAVWLEGTGGRLRLPPDAAPLSWWDRPRFGRQPIFGTTTGRLLDLSWEHDPTVSTCHGEVEAAARYDRSGRWIGLTARGEDGVPIEYQPA